MPLALIYEHRTYLPSVGLFLLVTALIYRYMPARQLRVAPLGVAVLVLAFWAHERSAVWADRLTLWQDVVDKAPDLPRVNLNLGKALYDLHEIDRALVHPEKAIAGDPKYADA